MLFFPFLISCFARFEEILKEFHPFPSSQGGLLNSLLIILVILPYVWWSFHKFLNVFPGPPA